MVKKKKAANAKSTEPQSKHSKATREPAKVGKGNPPKHSRFAKGTSGNLKGRPKGSKNLSTILMDAAKAPVTATIDGQRRKISTLVATAMQLATKAAGGDSKSVGQFLDWMDQVEARAAAAKPAEFPFTPGDIEVLRAVYERMKLSQLTETDEQ